MSAPSNPMTIANQSLTSLRSFQLSKRLHLPPEGINHEDRPHALLSMSQAERFMTCPGSVMLGAAVTTPNKSSEAAKEGTLAHTISEVMFRQLITPLFDHTDSAYPPVPPQYDPHLFLHCANYVKQVASLNGHLHVEVDLDFSSLHPKMGGTSDLVRIHGKTLHVGDLKFGKTPVSAKKNAQLMGYAVGARKTFQVKPKFIELSIYQPRGKDSTWACSADDLDAFEDKLVKVAYLTDDPFAPIVMSDKGCYWCKAKPICPEYTKAAKAAAASDFAGAVPKQTKGQPVVVVKPEKLLDNLVLAQKLIPWCDAVVQQAKDTLAQDIKALPGFTLKPGRTMTKWTDLPGALAFVQSSIVTLSPELKAKVKAGLLTTPTLIAPTGIADAINEFKLFTTDKKDLATIEAMHLFIVSKIDVSKAASSLATAKEESTDD